MKLKFIPIFLFIVTLQAAHSSGIGSTPPPQGKVIYTMNCTFVDDTGKAIGKSQKYILRKGGDGREQMEITSQENAHVPPPHIHTKNKWCLHQWWVQNLLLEQYSTDDRDQGR